jgi:3-hydroxyisobutyrate dehydrogenase
MGPETGVSGNSAGDVITPFGGTDLRIGFIGLGQMGGPMSLNIRRAGFDLSVHDIRRDAATEQLTAGASWAATPREAGSGRDVVITMLPTPRHVEEVLLGTPGAGTSGAGTSGAGGLLDGLAGGSVWIDMSTSIPAVAQRVRNLATPRGVRVLDAPVSGMAAGARAATLQIFVGGDAETYQWVRPVLEAMGDPARILHVGSHGAGYTVKLMINSLWFAHLAATAEVLTTGVRAGVDLATLRRALVASPANSNFVEHDVLSVLERGDYDDSFALALACKDLGLAVDLARDVGVPVEVSALVEQIYRRARAQYGDQGGEMLPVKLLEDVTGTQLRLDRPPPSPSPRPPESTA